MIAKWRRISDKASMYLPVLIMGLLALGTWWLVRNAPKPVSRGRKRLCVMSPIIF